MIKEHDRIVLTSDISGEGLKAGDVGMVVHVYKQGEAFEVEFLTLDGKTAAVATVSSSQVRPVSSQQMARPAPRPAYSVLSAKSLQGLGVSMAGWQDALRRYMAKRGN